MAHPIPLEEFEELTALVGPAMVRARELVADKALYPLGAGPEQRALIEEAQAMDLVVCALANTCGLDELPLFVALGSAIGTRLAQSSAPRAYAWKAFRDQVAQTFDEVTEAARPQGNA